MLFTPKDPFQPITRDSLNFNFLVSLFLSFRHLYSFHFFRNFFPFPQVFHPQFISSFFFFHCKSCNPSSAFSRSWWPSPRRSSEWRSGRSRAAGPKMASPRPRAFERPRGSTLPLKECTQCISQPMWKQPKAMQFISLLWGTTTATTLQKRET